MNLPKPLHCDAEFQCETKRRLFIGAFEKYKKETHKEKKKRRKEYEKKLRKRKGRKQELSSDTKKAYTNSDDLYSGGLHTLDTGLERSEGLHYASWEG